MNTYVAAETHGELLQLVFAESDIQARIELLGDIQLDGLDFGVIGFDSETIVRRYNAFETKCTGLPTSRVVGHPLFTVVAPCMNNSAPVIDLRFPYAG
jgi:photoactive yellow protein